MSRLPAKLRNLIIVLGDQLDVNSPAFEQFDAARDAVWMAEVDEESTHVWTAKQRIVVFLSAMRHFREVLEDKGYAVHYDALTPTGGRKSLSCSLRDFLDSHSPDKVIVVEPGEYRVRTIIESVCEEKDQSLQILDDGHFYSTIDGFKAWAEGRKELRMEYFYREMRKQHDILIRDGKPEGGDWNFDKDNRESFSKEGPGDLPSEPAHTVDAITDDVIKLVNKRFAKHPGSTDTFRWPVTRRQALAALRDFVKKRLPSFGRFQDAMWTGEPFLYHSLVSSSLNLKLLNPREVVNAAVEAYEQGDAPIAAVEGFVRQILGWREYVRGVYWMHMPEYLERNALGAEADLPDFYWTGETEFTCLREAIGQTLHHGYAHHIQRLMVTGLYAMLLGVDPAKVHEWYLAVYVDAVEWVELPNTLGMSQYADGGVMGSKPYAATGKYIQRMSNYCDHCPRNPAKATDEDACPFTALYWDFLDRNQDSLDQNRRMAFQMKNLQRKDSSELKAIREAAQHIKQNPAGDPCAAQPELPL